MPGWQQRGGLVGRGVLLDYKAWADAQGIRYSPYERHEISTATLEEVAAFQGTQFRRGDILIVRTGYTEGLLTDDAAAQASLLGTHKAVGVAGNEETARWVWNHHFAAVAGDALSFEVFPPTSGGIQNLGTHITHIPVSSPEGWEKESAKLIINSATPVLPRALWSSDW